MTMTAPQHLFIYIMAHRVDNPEADDHGTIVFSRIWVVARDEGEAYALGAQGMEAAMGGTIKPPGLIPENNWVIPASTISNTVSHQGSNRVLVRNAAYSSGGRWQQVAGLSGPPAAEVGTHTRTDAPPRRIETTHVEEKDGERGGERAPAGRKKGPAPRAGRRGARASARGVRRG